MLISPSLNPPAKLQWLEPKSLLWQGHGLIAIAHQLKQLINAFLYWNTPWSAGNELTPLNPLVGLNMRYGFPALGLPGVVAAINATHVSIPKSWSHSAVLASSGLGIVSSAIFDKLRTQYMIGVRRVWPSQLIDETR